MTSPETLALIEDEFDGFHPKPFDYDTYHHERDYFLTIIKKYQPGVNFPDEVKEAAQQIYQRRIACGCMSCVKFLNAKTDWALAEQVVAFKHEFPLGE
jgi:hypothetical protein